MLRIASYYEVLHRNDGNPLYVTACLKRFEEQGLLKFERLAPRGDYEPYGPYDLNFWIDWGEDALKGVLPYEPKYPPKPFVYWASDTHLGYDYRLSVAKKADFVFCAQKRAVEEFKRDGVVATWLPHAVEPLAYPRQRIVAKKYDIGFVGHINNQKRVDALDRMFKEFPNFYYGQRTFEQAAQKFGLSKIGFNISHVDDINMRTFEVMATGTMLLTEWLPTIEEVFEDKKHLVLYRSLDEAVDLAKYYLAHDSEREKIANEGCNFVLANHTIEHRVRTMLNKSVPNWDVKKELQSVASH